MAHTSGSQCTSVVSTIKRDFLSSDIFLKTYSIRQIEFYLVDKKESLPGL